MKILPLLALISLPLWGCGGDDSGSGADAAQQSVEQLFAAKCVGSGCHSGAVPANGLDLVSAGVADRINGRPATGCSGKITVVGGDPSSSYILEKLRGQQPTECGVQMPSGKPPLSAEEINAISNWIASLPPPDGGGDVDAMPPTGDAMINSGGNPGGGGGGGGGW